MLTLEDFSAFYPQFSGFTPEAVPRAYLAMANARFASFGEDAEEARRLLVAHKLTLYARTALPEDAQISKTAIAAAGQAQRIASKKVGEVAVTYASGASSAGSVKTEFADLAETDYGIQLLTLIRMYSRSMYVP